MKPVAQSKLLVFSVVTLPEMQNEEHGQRNGHIQNVVDDSENVYNLLKSNSCFKLIFVAVLLLKLLIELRLIHLALWR